VVSEMETEKGVKQRTLGKGRLNYNEKKKKEKYNLLKPC